MSAKSIAQLCAAKVQHFLELSKSDSIKNAIYVKFT